MIRTSKKLVVMIILTACCGSIWAGTGSGISNVFTIDNTNTDVDAPIITGISSQYCSYSGHVYFISGISLSQDFTATIDWNGFNASQVKWYRNNIVIATDSISGNSVSQTFDVGTDLNVGEKLYIQAIASDGTESAKIAANFDVISAPSGLGLLLYFEDGKYKSSSFGMDLPDFDYELIEEEQDNELTKIAQIGLSGAIDVYAEIDLYGYAIINAVNLDAKADGFKLSGLSLGADVDVALNYSYSGGQWYAGGQLGFGVNGEYETPSYYIVIFGVPAVYINCTLDAGFYSDCKFIRGYADTPLFSADIPAEAGIEAVLGAGVDGAINAEVYGTGRVHIDLQLPDEPILRDWYLEIGGGARWQVFFLSGEFGSFNYRWQKENYLSMNSLMIPLEKDFKPMSRDYINSDYAQWHDGHDMKKIMGVEALGAGGIETTLQTNIFGQSYAVMAVSGSSKCLVWLYDEPTRNSLDRTMLVYSINSGSGWSAPVAVDDDGTADVTPSLTVDANGNFVCVWANASQLIPDGTGLAGVSDKLDIQVAVYDAVGGTWASETVANTSALDYNPKVACDDNGDVTVIWTHDANNDILSENPPVSNTIMARTKAGAVWATAQALAPVSGRVKYTDIETGSTGSHVVYCLDSDSDLQTDTDNELYYINNAGGSWSAPARLTNDSVPDVNPQLVKTTSDLMLLWAKDGKIVSTADVAGMTGITDVVPAEGSSGQRSFVAAVSPTDNISVVWNDTSEAGSDIYTATYDPTMSAWSGTVQVTDNRDMERSITAVYSAGDMLEMAYNKVHIVDGQEGLNSFGQVDLCTYEYQIGFDLSVTSDSISIIESAMVHYKLDETSGAVLDNAGDFDGTNHGATPCIEGKVGDAYGFDGIDNYISTPFILDPADGPFSAFAWIKGVNDGGMIFCQTDGTGVGRKWLKVNADGFVATNIRSFDGVYGALASETNSCTDGDWHHVGIVWDGSRRYLYVDGVVVASDATNITNLEPCDGDLYIGAKKDLGPISFWEGQIDDVRIYKRELSEQTVVELFSDYAANLGNTVTLKATITNNGDTAISNIPVAFYCGDTPIAGNLIGVMQTITGPLAAGDEATASVSWTIPESDTALNIIVVIDPDLQIEDKNRQNNSASVEMFGANISIENVVISNDIFNNYYITADIVNTGFTRLPTGIKVQLVEASDESLIIDTQPVAALEQNQTHSVTLTASSSKIDYGIIELKLNADSDNIVNEISENDNTKNVLIRNTVPYDLVVDGYIDLLDLSILASQWLSTTGHLTADIAPTGGDGEVDLLDLSTLADNWHKRLGVMVHYKFDETSGAVLDNAGDFDGTNHGATPGIEGKVGDAYGFDGIDNYISTPFILDPADGPFSAFAWIKGVNDGGMIFCQTDGAGIGRKWINVNADGFILTKLSSSDGVYGALASESNSCTDGNWHHVGIVWDGSRRYLYVDGVVVASDATNITNLQPCDGELYIGTHKNLTEGSFWEGQIDDVRIYKRALSEIEVQSLSF